MMAIWVLLLLPSGAVDLTDHPVETLLPLTTRGLLGSSEIPQRNENISVAAPQLLGHTWLERRKLEWRILVRDLSSEVRPTPPTGL